MKIEYRGEEIAFVEHNETWTWQGYSNTSLAKVKAHIDRAQKKAFESLVAWYDNWRFNGNNKWELVKVTSFTDDNKEAWIVIDGKRSKVELTALIKDTPENLALIEQHKDAREQQSELRKREQSIKKSMERLAPLEPETDEA